MHARIDQLLSLRDRAPVDGAAARHVEGCAQCAAELRRLIELRDRMQQLPTLPGPPDAWPRIETVLASRRARQVRLRRGAIAATIVLAAAAAIGLYGDSTPQTAQTPSPVPLQGAEAHAAFADLVARSRVLDEMLQTLPRRPAVERVSMAATIDTIEERIQWLDFHLSYAPVELDDAQAQRLWSERVELMDSLVKIRYAEARRTSF